MTAPRLEGRVAVFVAVHLPRSQTFIAEQLRRHVRYVPEVFARSLANRDEFPFEPVHVGGRLYGVTGYSRSVRRVFEERDFAVVHAHFGTVAMYALPYARRYDLPLVVSYHGYDVGVLTNPRRAHPRHWPYIAAHRRVLRRTTLALCASEELAQLLMARGADPARVVVHRLGIDTSRFTPQPRADAPFTVAMIGRLVEKKGFADGLRAVAGARRRGVDVSAMIVGEGPLGGELRALAEQEAIGDHVTFAGAQPYSEVAGVLCRAHVLLAPSAVASDGDRDSGLMVVKEAAAGGAVPIGTRHGGIPEMIRDGETGYLVDEHDVDAMTERLVCMANDPVLRQALAEAARDDVRRRFDSAGSMAELESLYDRARREHGAAHRP